ncbi:DUF2384 domain-containing protein [Candidatus Peregrinibacteria bacterium]|nr:DUF2384 domain-containing protein [Candidatus Peregrinibacteria bacterium]
MTLKSSPTAQTIPALALHETASSRPPASIIRERVQKTLDPQKSQVFIKALGDIRRKWKLEGTSAAHLLGCDENRFEEIMSGQAPTFHEAARLMPAIVVFRLVDEKFIPTEADKWMNRPSPALNGQIPKELIFQEGGLAKITSYLKALPDRRRNA